MKKFFAILICTLIVFTFTASVSVFAAEPDGEPDAPVTAPAEENPADEEIQPDTGTETPAPGEDAPKAFYSDWIDKITSSTVWISIATFLATAGGLFAVIKSSFGNVIALINKKATAEEIADAMKKGTSEITDAFREEYEKLKVQLSATVASLEQAKETEDKMLAVLGIFMSNAKINPNAREKITEILLGMEQVNGTVGAFIEKANAEIRKADAAEEKKETPALDALLAEENPVTEEENIGIGVI